MAQSSNSRATQEDEFWTANTESSALNTTPSRTVESHVKTGDRTVDKRLRRVLILDTDPDTLISLQHLLEGAHIDSTITWDEAEARQLLGSIAVDLMLIYDHPPEVNAAAILRDLSSRESILPVLILRGVAGENDHDQFRRLGAMGVVPRHDFVAVLERVKQTLLSAGCENNCVKASAEGVSAQAT